MNTWISKQQRFLVIDVECIGLMGEAFAWGGVLIDPIGYELKSWLESCHPSTADGPDGGREWVTQNVPRLPYTCASPRALRASFWKKWCELFPLGVTLVADIPWPCEANFLRQCVVDHGDLVNYMSPLPILDVASILAAAGLDPIDFYDRHPQEEPMHNPLCDARQSARLFLQALRTLGALEK